MSTQARCVGWAALLTLAAGCVERGEVLSRNRLNEPGQDAAPSTTSASDDGTDDDTSTGTLPSTELDDSNSVPSAEGDEAGASMLEPTTTEAGASQPMPTQSATGSVMPDAAVPPSSSGVDVDASSPEWVSEASQHVSSGANHTCAVFTSGIACWGSNASGQLGLGDALDRAVPTLLANTAGFRDVQAAGQHSCALDVEGGVWCWGANDRGQLATGDRQSRPAPVAVSLPAPATSLASHFNHVCALLNDASLFCWGENFEGQLGQADRFPGDQNQTGADALSALQVYGEGWLAVDTGQGHTCAIASEGSLWCWGRNTTFELGAGTEIQVREPQRVDDALDWAAVSSGQASNLALKRDGSLWCWGFNVGFADGGGAPLGVPAEDAPSPTRVGDQVGWLAPSTRIFHSCALRADQLWCWGRNAEGQLGLGDLDRRTEPTLVGAGYIEVSSGPFGTCGLTSAGNVECTGKNDVGELGTGDTERRSEFTAVLGQAR